MAVALLGSTSLMAQRGERPHKEMSPEEKLEKHIEKVSSELGLSDDQRARYTELATRHQAEKKAMREAQKASAKEQKAELRSRHDAELQKILTTEQYAKMVEMREKRMEQRKERMDDPEKKERMRRPHQE